MSESTRKGEKPLFSIFVWFSLLHQEECFTVNCGGGGEGHIMMICAGFNLNLSFKLTWEWVEPNFHIGKSREGEKRTLQRSTGKINPASTLFGAAVSGILPPLKCGRGLVGRQLQSKESFPFLVDRLPRPPPFKRWQLSGHPSGNLFLSLRWTQRASRSWKQSSVGTLPLRQGQQPRWLHRCHLAGS